MAPKKKEPPPLGPGGRPGGAEPFPGAVERAVSDAEFGKRLLNYVGSDFGADGAGKLAEVLGDEDWETQGLRELSLRGASVGPQGCIAIAEALVRQEHGSMRRLDLTNNDVGDDGAARLAAELQPRKSLRLLLLAGNNIGDAGATALAKLLHEQKALEELRLGNNKITAEGAKSIAAVVLHPSLLVLGLENNPITDVGGVALAEALALEAPRPEEEPRPPLHPTLTGIRHQPVGPAMLPRPRDHELKGLPPPRGLLGSHAPGGGARGASFGGQGLRSRGGPKGCGRAALAALPGLRVIHLGGCSLSDPSALGFAAALEARRDGPLKELHLGKNTVSDAGAQRLAQAVEGHKSLKVLWLEQNKIGDVGCLALVAALARMPREDLHVCVTGCKPKPPKGVRSAPKTARFDDAAMSDLSRTARTARDVSRRGVTLHRLLKLLHSEVAAGKIDELTSTTASVVQTVIIPDTEDYWKSYSVFFNKPVPDVYVIHSWGGLFRDLVYALARHATGILNPSLDPDNIMWEKRFPEALQRCYYIDAFALDNKLIGAPMDARCEYDKFDAVMSLIQLRGGECVIVMDESYTALTSMWCLTESYHCLVSEMPLRVLFGKSNPFPRRRRGWGKIAESYVSRDCDKTLLNSVAGSRGATLQDAGEMVRVALTALIAMQFQEDRAILPAEQLYDLQMLEMEMHKEEQKAATDCQRFWRGVLGRRRAAERRRQVRDAAATRIQSRQRGIMGRVRASARANGIVRIQRWFRRVPPGLTKRRRQRAREAEEARKAAQKLRYGRMLESVVAASSPRSMLATALACKAGASTVKKARKAHDQAVAAAARAAEEAEAKAQEALQEELMPRRRSIVPDADAAEAAAQAAAQAAAEEAASPE
eukprot:TRINITY_DN16021_c0_g2_i1.p1 TRINITY_DN16021_c0_g2~~TRINITY_DN16021_c0_g2_i1.p1  ORF type:complete len:880 (+),score=187.39 TRINITY_DN16021_c0_g2_i1:135-2774(+)